MTSDTISRTDLLLPLPILNTSKPEWRNRKAAINASATSSTCTKSRRGSVRCEPMNPPAPVAKILDSGIRSPSLRPPQGGLRIHLLNLIDVSLETAARAQFESVETHPGTNFGVGKFDQRTGQGIGIIRVVNQAALPAVSE